MVAHTAREYSACDVADVVRVQHKYGACDVTNVVVHMAREHGMRGLSKLESLWYYVGAILHMRGAWCG